jgi:periplasmic divalent cation tolerance protein
MQMENIVVLMTASNDEEAAKIARALVDSGLAGCVNIVRGVRSIYRWKGRIEDEAEVLMIAKTAKDKFDELSRKVKEMHSYTVPEIIAFPIVEGSREYLDWLRDATG